MPQKPRMRRCVRHPELVIFDPQTRCHWCNEPLLPTKMFGDFFWFLIFLRARWLNFRERREAQANQDYRNADDTV